MMCVFRKCHPGARSAIGFIAITSLLLFLVACGDDESSFTSRPGDDSSTETSSSVVQSSSERSEEDPSSSSVKSDSSSATSSSSATLATPCKTETEDNCEYGELVDERDGQVYKTVKIGKQVWMAENLNFDTDSSFCTKDSVRYCDKYGRLYVWGTAVDNRGKWSANCKYCDDTKTCPMIEPVRGVCPAGWHLPSKAEWDTLYTAVGGESTAGKVLKSLSGWYKDGNGTDDFGFSVLPAGYGAGNMAYYRETYDAYFWASTDGGSNGAYSRELNWDRDSADWDGNYKYYGYSVRCIKDQFD